MCFLFLERWRSSEKSAICLCLCPSYTFSLPWRNTRAWGGANGVWELTCVLQRKRLPHEKGPVPTHLKTITNKVLSKERMQSRGRGGMLSSGRGIPLLNSQQLGPLAQKEASQCPALTGESLIGSTPNGGASGRWRLGEGKSFYLGFWLTMVLATCPPMGGSVSMCIHEALTGFHGLRESHGGGREQRNERRSWGRCDQDMLSTNKSNYSKIK